MSAMRRIDLLLLVERFLEALDRDDVYGALAVDPRADEGEIDRRLRKMRALFTDPPPGLARTDYARIEVAVRRLNITGAMLRDYDLRLEYDLRHHLVFAEQRIEAASATGQDVEALRRVWQRVYTDHAREAEALAEEATAAERCGAHDQARCSLARAIELDPFDLRYRRMLSDVDLRASSSQPSRA
jgi:hypothetical protein